MEWLIYKGENDLTYSKQHNTPLGCLKLVERTKTIELVKSMNKHIWIVWP